MTLKSEKLSVVASGGPHGYDSTYRNVAEKIGGKKPSPTADFQYRQ